MGFVSKFLVLVICLAGPSFKQSMNVVQTLILVAMIVLFVFLGNI